MRSPTTEAVDVDEFWVTSFSLNAAPSGLIGLIGLIGMIGMIGLIGVIGLMGVIGMIGASLSFGFSGCVFELDSSIVASVCLIGF